MYNVYMWEGLLDVVVVFIGEFGVTVVIVVVVKVVVVGIVTTVV